MELKSVIKKVFLFSNRGFTMLELIVVITIVSVIAGLAIVSYNKTVEHTKEREASLHLRSIYVAMKDYYFNEKEYPNNGIMGDYFEINTILGLNLPPPMEGLHFYCENPAGDDIKCVAARNDLVDPDWALYTIGDSFCFGKPFCGHPPCPSIEVNPPCIEDEVP